MDGDFLRLKLNLFAKISLFLLLLGFFSLPSIAQNKFMNLPITFNQLLIIALSAILILLKPRFPNISIIKSMFLLFCLIVPYNSVSILLLGYDQSTILIRGIFNFTMNMMLIILISLSMIEWIGSKLFSKIIVLFGNLVALSGVVEFALLKLSIPLIEKWRVLVWGNMIEPTDLLDTGGAIVNPLGLSRVGGIVGGPENFGYVLSLTLPFALFAQLRGVMYVWLISLYAIAIVVSGSRTLGIALIIYTLMLISHKRHIYLTIGIFMAWILSLIVVISTDLNLDTFTRFTQEAFYYEMEWRGERIYRLIEAMSGEHYAVITGIGLGWGAEEQFGLRYLTSGILGGDVTAAYGLGGIVGLVILLGMWVTILKIRKELKSISDMARLSMNMYVIFLVVISLFMPMLMQIIFNNGIIILLLVAFLVMIENYARFEYEN